MFGPIGGGISGGAGGISPSSSSTATNGDYGASAGYGGSFVINSGPQKSESEKITQYVVIGVVVIVGLLVWLKK